MYTKLTYFVLQSVLTQHMYDTATVEDFWESLAYVSELYPTKEEKTSRHNLKALTSNYI